MPDPPRASPAAAVHAVLICEPRPLLARAARAVLEDAGLAVLASVPYPAGLPEGNLTATTVVGIPADARSPQVRDTLAAVRARISRRARIVALVGTSSAHVADVCLSSGAAAVVHDGAPFDALVTAVMSDQAARPARSEATLTAREREVLLEAAAGHTNAEIAAVLFVSPETVKTTLTRIYRKLGAADRASAVYRAVQDELL